MCQADCGPAPTRDVTVNFYDPWKLWYAYQIVDDAFENGWQGLSAFRWGAADVNGERLVTPAAGWNICSKEKKEFGFFEYVCVFDGDVFIEGLPYRTAELDVNSGKFGDSKVCAPLHRSGSLALGFKSSPV